MEIYGIKKLVYSIVVAYDFHSGIILILLMQLVAVWFCLPIIDLIFVLYDRTK